jgi:hypothetical protein
MILSVHLLATPDCLFEQFDVFLWFALVLEFVSLFAEFLDLGFPV